LRCQDRDDYQKRVQFKGVRRLGKSAAKKAEQLQSEAANRFTEYSKQLSAEAAPARKLTQDYYTSVVKGGPEAYKAISPQVDFTKTQFRQARKQLDAGVPAGGARQRGYQQLAGAEAGTISGLFRDKINEILGRLQESGQFGTQAGISATGGVAGAGESLARLAASRANAVAGGLGGIAGALGTYFGMRGSGATT
jgi:hypothetical protein